MKQIFVFFGFIFIKLQIYSAYFTNFKVNKYETCNNTQLEIIHHGFVILENGKQYFTHNLTIPHPLGENVGMSCLIQTKTFGDNFVELFTIREKNFCKAFNKYLGEFWYKIQMYSHMAPGVCPVQQGRYHGHHILLDFEKITLQTFPFGTIRFTIEAIHNKKKNVELCMIIEVDNLVN